MLLLTRMALLSQWRQLRGWLLGGLVQQSMACWLSIVRSEMQKCFVLYAFIDAAVKLRMQIGHGELGFHEGVATC